MKDYVQYVDTIVKAFGEAKNLPAPKVPVPGKPGTSGTVLMICPHPDDEMLIGALPLRLLRQCGMRVIDLSATLGSKRERQLARFAELRDACAYVGLEARTIGERGLEGINPEAPAKDPAKWAAAVDAVADVIREVKPDALFFPHALDANRTHRGVHLLAVAALAKSGATTHVFETEFWSAMAKPNLAVESTPRDVADLVSALSLHKGEVARNPYHLRQPGWMIDNVRRGAELVGGQGGDAPDFIFATLYRHSVAKAGRIVTDNAPGVFLKASEKPSLPTVK